MQKVLVTGATGFIGANVTRLLSERGADVRVLVRPTSDRRNLAGLEVEAVEGDLRDPESVRRSVRGCRQVFHVGADYRFWARDPREIYRSNVEGTTHVMEACLSAGVERVVYTSTVGTIGLAAHPAPCDEMTRMLGGQLTSHYKRSKLQAEQAVLSYAARGLPVVIVNPSAPIGPWDAKPTPTGQLIVDFVRGKLSAIVDTGLNIVHVRDVAEGHLLAAERGRIGERYILGHRNMTLRRDRGRAGRGHGPAGAAAEAAVCGGMDGRGGQHGGRDLDHAPAARHRARGGADGAPAHVLRPGQGHP